MRAVAYVFWKYLTQVVVNTDVLEKLSGRWGLKDAIVKVLKKGGEFIAC